MSKKQEAQRRQHLAPEIVHWSIRKRARTINTGEKVKAGMVVVENRHGAQWAMSPADFDNFYKAR